jgi:prolyl oligopeptidase
MPERFNTNHLSIAQGSATSADGTAIPYFLVYDETKATDGQNPTLLYGYGGFELSLTPTYLSTIGKAWLEKGGFYAVANIRGGGEFGPKWHQAALTTHRQRAYDDFAAVAQDLIARKITSPRRLGISGRSNGGLLMGVSFTQHPELFNGVLCGSPLLDMMRYPHLLAGASWIGEYGNPEDPAMAPIIARYSPYQNVRAGVKYPKVFFTTSTRDDRVSPAHARKMAAKMESLGNSVLFYENTEGGHAAAANLEQRVTNSALEFTFLYQQLFD